MFFFLSEASLAYEPMTQTSYQSFHIFGKPALQKNDKTHREDEKKYDNVDKGTLEKIPKWLLMFFGKIIIFLKGDFRASGWVIFV